MRNQEIAKIFYSISDYLSIDNVSFKPQAYQKAAVAIEALEEDIGDIYKRGGLKALEEIPGVGKSIAEKIEEYLKTGRVKYYELFKKKLPINLEEIIRVEGMGPKKAKILYEKLGVRNIKDLERAAKVHKIAPLFGFGAKTEKNILEGIEFLKRSKGRFLLGDILPKVNDIYAKLKSLKEVEEISLAGSVRRMKETIGDVDFLVISRKPDKVMDFFTGLPDIIKVWGKGNTKASIRVGLDFDPLRRRFSNGIDMDIRVVPPKSYGAALQYFTGSKEHNIATRLIAMNKGLKLSEYGLFRGAKLLASKKEEDIYKYLGMPWIEPELRENQGEVEAALLQAQNKKNGLPKIIGYSDIWGDLHCHSDWDGGENSIQELAQEAQEMGYQYLGVADHTKFLRIEHGLNEKQLEKRNKGIDKLNARYKMQNKKFRLLKGCEANIMPDGSIDIAAESLSKLDFVIAGIHSSLKMEKAKMTDRIIRAMKNPHVDIISHPTGRLIQRRDEYQTDFDAVLRAARETKTIMEINAHPERLDLSDKNIRRAKEAGVKMVINTDSHQKGQMRLVEFGIAQARRGWAEKDDIINCWPLDKLLHFFK